jgi:hypothetical protein
VTWPEGRAATLVLDAFEPVERAAPGAYPVPDGRGQWRLTLHSRDFTGTESVYASTIGALPDATARVLTRAWNQPAQLDFTIDGRSEQAQLIAELQQDIVAWRWDDTAGVDRPLFRGVISQTQDVLDEDHHVINVTAHDYLALFARRTLINPVTYTAADQDDIMADLLSKAINVSTLSGTSLSPACVLPVTLALVNPDGSVRSSKSGQLRTVTYNASTDLLSIVDELNVLVNGFDVDLLPTGLNGTADALRIFFPYQGVQRTDLALVYGSTVSKLQRQVDSSTYGNFWRAVGNNGSAAVGAAQLVAEAWNVDAASVARQPIGLWQSTDNAPAVGTQAQLQDQANGDLGLYGSIIPTYTLTLAPGAYSYGAPYMGDVVPLVVQSGRLNVNTNVRVLGITYRLNDDTATEDVDITVGKPGRTLVQMIQQAQSDVNALARR